MPDALVCRLAVRVAPRASRETVVGMRGGVLLVRVTAPPVEGAANEAVLRLVARRLRIAPRQVRIVSGMTSKSKVIEVSGIAEAEVLRILGAPARSEGGGAESDEAAEPCP